MSKFPALPLFGDAFSAATWHLSDAEVGRYIRVLLLMWETPGCRVPNDNEWLARRLKKSVEDVETEIRPIIKEFCKTDGNWIWQKRLRKEFAYVKTTSRQRTVAAKSRWNKEKGRYETDAAPHPPRNAPHLTSPNLFNIEGEASASPPPRSRKNGCQLSEDWQPKDSTIQWAFSQGFNREQIDAEFNHFRDWHIGKGTIWKDWDKAFQTWLRKELKNGRRQDAIRPVH